MVCWHLLHFFPPKILAFQTAFRLKYLHWKSGLQLWVGCLAEWTADAYISNIEDLELKNSWIYVESLRLFKTLSWWTLIAHRIQCLQIDLTCPWISSFFTIVSLVEVNHFCWHSSTEREGLHLSPVTSRNCQTKKNNVHVVTFLACSRTVHSLWVTSCFILTKWRVYFNLVRVVIDTENTLDNPYAWYALMLP